MWNLNSTKRETRVSRRVFPRIPLLKTGRRIDSPRVQRQLSVQNTRLDSKLLKEQLEPVRSIDIVDEEDALPLDESKLEQDVGEEELVGFRALDVVLGEEGGGSSGIFFESKDGLGKKRRARERLGSVSFFEVSRPNETCRTAYH